jgi:hypothetical protein
VGRLAAPATPRKDPLEGIDLPVYAEWWLCDLTRIACLVGRLIDELDITDRRANDLARGLSPLLRFTVGPGLEAPTPAPAVG